MVALSLSVVRIAATSDRARSRSANFLVRPPFALIARSRYANSPSTSSSPVAKTVKGWSPAHWSVGIVRPILCPAVTLSRMVGAAWLGNSVARIKRDAGIKIRRRTISLVRNVAVASRVFSLVLRKKERHRRLPSRIVRSKAQNATLAKVVFSKMSS